MPIVSRPPVKQQQQQDVPVEQQEDSDQSEQS